MEVKLITLFVFLINTYVALTQIEPRPAVPILYPIDASTSRCLARTENYQTNNQVVPVNNWIRFQWPYIRFYVNCRVYKPQKTGCYGGCPDEQTMNPTIRDLKTNCTCCKATRWQHIAPKPLCDVYTYHVSTGWVIPYPQPGHHPDPLNGHAYYIIAECACRPCSINTPTAKAYVPEEDPSKEDLQNRADSITSTTFSYQPTNSRPISLTDKEKAMSLIKDGIREVDIPSMYRSAAGAISRGSAATQPTSFSRKLSLK